MTFGEEYGAELAASITASLIVVPFFYWVYGRWVKNPELSLRVAGTGAERFTDRKKIDVARVYVVNTGRTVFDAGRIQFILWTHDGRLQSWGPHPSVSCTARQENHGEEIRGQLNSNLYPGAVHELGSIEIPHATATFGRLLLLTPSGLFPRRARKFTDPIQQLEHAFSVFRGASNGVEFGDS